jgi:hypothetical protein
VKATEKDCLGKTLPPMQIDRLTGQVYDAGVSWSRIFSRSVAAFPALRANGRFTQQFKQYFVRDNTSSNDSKINYLLFGGPAVVASTQRHTSL